jgi:1-aminocyclopropane-1-carboxylate deaminase/D-cysteine desulfhydrase-like pyridoxal-dependent ACC family enzyme
MAAAFCTLSPSGAQDTFTAIQAKGAGYAISQQPELQTVLDVAQASGIVLDPVYSGKALHCMLERIRAQPEAWKGKRVLFIHTGGLLVG